ncbi:hypothetical protein LMH66_20190 [Shewanella sp. 10N.7]|uniref:hypothetical protein n=1 Tax=Shewanella sp. 10N.7 TaxID=2885093 RepID=UPI001E633EB0|nr:hypothetical protein [Shewanella sp. 10N.7]MCC4834966.1 hypothetical protein [Shewanella sp. 10N.7]
MSLFVGNKYDQNMAKFHSAKRFEREAWMPNWPFNMDAYVEIKSRRVLDVSAQKVTLSHLTHRDMGNVIMM